MRPRLPEGPNEAIDRGRGVVFRLDGKTLQALHGDTVGSALAGEGIAITGRSFKYHRPRGLVCMTGSCPNCLVTVDGVPNVRACTEPVRDGMQVRRQNFWGTADHDLLGAVDTFSFLLPPGFYYKIFHRPAWLWPLVEPFIRRVAGLGTVPAGGEHRHRARISLHPDVLVVGGGPAGLAAAAESARAGARTLLIEERGEVGGHLLAADAVDVPAEGLSGTGGKAAAEVLEREASEAGAEILSATSAFGSFEGPVVAAAGSETLYRIRAKTTVFATGATEQPSVFPDNDLPGVMLSSAADLLVQRYRVLPGRRAVVSTGSDDGYRTARSLAEAGADVTVIDLREDAAGAAVDDARRAGVRIVPGAAIRRAEGRRRVRRAVFGPVANRAEDSTDCDVLVIAGVRAPSANLLAQAGVERSFDEAAQAFLPRSLPSWMSAAGEVAGIRSLDAIIASGRVAGVEAARAAGREGSVDAAALEALRQRSAAGSPAVVLPPATGDGDGKQFACLCMDVTDKELKAAVDEGFDSMELLKRYTTITMGPCQGKACLLPSQRLCASATGQTLAEARPTTARPPWTPVTLGVLAAGQRTPRKETPMHDVHVDAGATFMWAGDWRRPHHYADPHDEARAVHERVGLIDVSTLGKFRVKGPDAVALLERLYPSRFADLRIGRIRYVLMLNDEGVILDDGIVCRTAEDEFFLTATTGNTAAVERWIDWWLADWDLDVRVLNVTSAFAAVNLAGPRARKVMERVSSLDVSPDGLPYLASVSGEVAGAPSLVIRIGFVGELGYEIHFPSAYGDDVWRRLLEAGRDLGIRPFGLEAQRILRLEKQHVLIGQDTDAESDPYEIGMSWMVRLDKEDFLGRASLVESSTREPTERLVGFVMDGGILPPEGSAIIEDGRWVGRVTSSRRSAATGEGIGLGWVPASRAAEGEPISIRVQGATFGATVRLAPFYDPEGARLRS